MSLIYSIPNSESFQIGAILPKKTPRNQNEFRNSTKQRAKSQCWNIFEEYDVDSVVYDFNNEYNIDYGTKDCDQTQKSVYGAEFSPELGAGSSPDLGVYNDEYGTDYVPEYTDNYNNEGTMPSNLNPYSTPFIPQSLIPRSFIPQLLIPQDFTKPPPPQVPISQQIYVETQNSDYIMLLGGQNSQIHRANNETESWKPEVQPQWSTQYITVSPSSMQKYLGTIHEESTTDESTNPDMNSLPASPRHCSLSSSRKNALSDKLLMYIIRQYIPEFDWMSVSQVCRQWRYCATMISKQKKGALVYRNSLEKYQVQYSSPKPQQPIPMKFTTNEAMTSLSFAGTDIKLEGRGLLQVGEAFPQLTELCLGDASVDKNPKLTPACIRVFESTFQRVQLLKIESCFTETKLFPNPVTKHDRFRLTQAINNAFSETFSTDSCLQKLSHFSVKDNDVLNGSFLKFINTALYSIELSLCSGILEYHIRGFLQNRTHLKMFKFRGEEGGGSRVYPSVTKASLCELLTYSNLEGLDLSYLNGWLSSVPLTCYSTELSYLDLTRSKVFVEADLQKILKLCTKLKVIKLAHMRNITDNVIHTIIRNTKLVEFLDLRGFTNTRMLLKLVNLRNLTEITLTETNETSMIAQKLCAKLPKLKIDIVE